MNKDTSNPNDSPLIQGGGARKVAFWTMIIPGLVCLFVAFVGSWPLGPGYVDEGGITQLRLALAFLALGLLFVLGFLGSFLAILLDLPIQVKRLSDEVKKAGEGKP